MNWKITVLCENTTPLPGLVGEYGFSAFVETPDATLLFDTGAGFGLIPNAMRLQKDLRRASALVLSHGHFDHTGGMLAFLGAHGPCDVIAHPDAVGERFRWMPDGGEEKLLSIGMPWREAYVASRGARFVWKTQFEEIAPNVFITGEVPRKTSFETGDPKFAVRKDGEWAPDPFADDYSLALRTPKGLVLVLGCAHAGVVNILNHVMERTGENRVHAILGGTHLGFCPKDQLKRTIEELHRINIEKLAVSHCTGQGPAALLSAHFTDAFAFAPVGYTIEV
jgi:7,8-dihydropterin-6-yl-methyl-4-(beta-D-ribofuranosyl)aminobenzene 5'-phosphate synthase